MCAKGRAASLGVMPIMRQASASVFRRGLSREQAAGYIGVSPSTFDKMVIAGQMPGPKRIGTRKVWDVRALDVAIDNLPGEDSVPETNDWD